VVILIDAETFGGAPGTQQLAMQIKMMRIPIRMVTNGQDLREALLTPF
jgi:hypothetical protein